MSEPIKINGRIVESGTEVSVAGERGRFIFRHLNRDGSGTFYGGPNGYGMFRAFRLERVATVHSKPKLRSSLEALS